MTARIIECTEAEYHSDPCDTPSLSSSIAKLMVDASPEHAYLAHPRLGGRRLASRVTEKTADVGTMLHTGLLGVGPELAVCTVVYDEKHKGPTGEPVRDWKTKAAQEQKAKARACGQVPALQHEANVIMRACAEYKRRLAKRGIDLAAPGSMQEVTIVWEERATNGTQVLCRARLDWLNLVHGKIKDIKSCRSAHPKAIRAAIRDYAYDIQNAAYESALGHLDTSLRGRTEYELVFCEKTEPYPVTTARLTESYKQLGRLKWQQAVDIWADCLQHDEWPSYTADDEVVMVEPSPWEMQEIMEVA